MALFSMFKINKDNYSARYLCKNCIRYVILLHFSLVLQYLVFKFIMKFELMGSIVLRFLLVLLFIDIIAITFFTHLHKFETLVSVVILLYSNTAYFLLGGFYINSGAMLLGLLVPLGVASLYDVRKRKVLCKSICFFLVVLVPFIASFVFHKLLDPLLRTLPTDFKNMDNFNQLEGILITLNLTTFSIVSFTLLYSIANKNKELQSRAIKLIKDIMPHAVAEKILDNQKNIESDYFPRTTILVADIANFTNISSKISAAELVDNLNTLFSEFDKLCLKYNLEKIKTVGDAYLVGNGMYAPHNPDQVVKFAFELLVVKNRIKFFQNEPCQMKVAIHSGSLYGGILGEKYFHDIWGDTVYYADYLSNFAGYDKIVISPFTRYQLVDNYNFTQITTEGYRNDIVELFKVEPVGHFIFEN